MADEAPILIYEPHPWLACVVALGMWIGAVFLIDGNMNQASAYFGWGLLRDSSTQAVVLGVALVPTGFGVLLYWPERTYIVPEGLLSVRGVLLRWSSVLPKASMERIALAHKETRRGHVRHTSWMVELHRPRRFFPKWLKRFGSHQDAKALAQQCARAWDLPDP